MLGEPHLKALRTVCSRLEGAAINWVLTDSTAFAAQGLPLQPHDIDLQADAAGAHAIEAALKEYMVEPVAFSSSGRIRSHFGRAILAGVRVEIMGDVEVLLPDGTWRPPPDIPRLRRWVTAGGLRLPVLPLEYECRAYLQLGRLDRAELLRRYLS
ncbi:MAG: hypothetical protein HPY83_08090 [Anaerolineae bacterium]|nr:hypothetical protein [Anaerolineae bacterium]